MGSFWRACTFTYKHQSCIGPFWCIWTATEKFRFQNHLIKVNEVWDLGTVSHAVIHVSVLDRCLPYSGLKSPWSPCLQSRADSCHNITLWSFPNGDIMRWPLLCFATVWSVWGFDPALPLFQSTEVLADIWYWAILTLNCKINRSGKAFERNLIDISHSHREA